MGKTSVTDFVKDFVAYKKNMIGVYVSNKGNDSIEKLTTIIIEMWEFHNNNDEKQWLFNSTKCY